MHGRSVWGKKSRNKEEIRGFIRVRGFTGENLLGLDSDFFYFLGLPVIEKIRKKILETTAGTVFCELLFCTSYINTKY